MEEAEPDTTHPQKSRRGSGRKILRSVFIVVITAALLGGYYVATQQNDDSESSQQKKAVTSTPATPGDKVILPENKTIEELGGWRRVSPPGNDPVFSYTDEIEGINVSVSQQPLPKSFKGDVPGKISELAKGYNATVKIEAGNTIAYIGTSAKGPQSVILTKNDLLILMKSEKQIADTAWADYIKKLYSPDFKNVPKF